MGLILAAQPESGAMNRIYQGRVTKVEIPNGKDADGKPLWKELPKAEWQQALWHHHQLFQDAVNYYAFALAVMASGIRRKRMTKEKRNRQRWRGLANRFSATRSR